MLVATERHCYAMGGRRLQVVHLAISELLTYSALAWTAFIAVAFLAALFLRIPGIFLGHIVIAIAVAVLDVQWIQSEIHKPGWIGQPDQDIVFMIGIFLRVILINTVLLPISFVSLRINRRYIRKAVIQPIA